MVRAATKALVVGFMACLSVVAQQGCTETSSGEPAPTGPIRCISGSDCPSRLCADPEKGLLVGRDARAALEGLCCAEDRFPANPAARTTGCDNTCGKPGCFRSQYEAHRKNLKNCGEPCTTDADCVDDAYCKPETYDDQGNARGPRCLPRACIDCFQESPEAFCEWKGNRDTLECEMVTCDVPRCGQPCNTDQDCSQGRCVDTPAAGKQCVPRECTSCFASGDGCGFDIYTCAYEGCGCTPKCDGKSCGSDGCGGVCGTCGPGEDCASGRCVPCPEVGEECESGLPDCHVFRKTCRAGHVECRKTSELKKAGSPCEDALSGRTGVCLSNGACGLHDDGGTSSGGTSGGGTSSGGTSSGGMGTSGGTSDSCNRNDLLRLVESESDSSIDFLCTPSPGGSVYWGRFQNLSSSTRLYCLICARLKSTGKPTDCLFANIAPGATFSEWAAGANVHCTGNMTGYTYSCVDDADVGCRIALYESYKGLLNQ